MSADTPKLDPKYIVTISGKEAVLYAGLLEYAHQIGLRSIRTELKQIPTPENGNVAVVHATAEMLVGDIQKSFEGIGDAAPNNCARAMHTCLMRLAETRAKARALRDATNIGMVAYDEIDESGGAGARPASTKTAPRAAQNAQAAAALTPGGSRLKAMFEQSRLVPSVSLVANVLHISHTDAQEYFRPDASFDWNRPTKDEKTALYNHAKGVAA